MIQLLTISVGKAAPLFAGEDRNVPEKGGQSVLSGIRKKPVSTADDPQAIAVHALGLAGDEQADLTVHGGRNQAVYAYPVEHYPVWQTMRMQALKIDEALPHGSFGENLTIAGLLEVDAWIGDVLVFGDSPVRMRITRPRSPCFKFNAVMGFKQASRMMVQSGYTGFYLEVLQTGSIRAGTAVTIVPGDRQMRIEELHRNRSYQQDDLF